MSVEQAVIAQLVADADVAALVGTRVYQLKLPEQPTLPAVRVQLIDEPLSYHQRGVNGLRRARVQTDAYAWEYDTAHPEPYATANDLADAIDHALSGQSFSDAESPNTVQVSGCFRETRIPMYEAEELRIVRILQDYIVWWTPIRM